ncbi:MAG: hypothetical protein OHM56_07670 [Spiroplasma phoeniceum]|nr:MAG: hypothetical protein OHM57_06880 [Spiroplasma phoeniceum]UZQ29103.1 MAG: hypothetical protein OHM57_07070 [Spiroplasma phoeniceum]UZQ31477.1 MAG: hypothetical protein OHM56_07480 [Spiroplasma phoeniceum]UZQ31513.1 MAG: hypothetical protein OHM56_07670 [Spiroplasma phoeniceum]
MKKLLSLLSVLTISGSAIPSTIAASPYQKEEILNRNKRNSNDEVAIYIGNHEDNIIFTRNDYDFKWLPSWGLNWIIKINQSGIIKVLNWIKNNPTKAKNAGSIMAGVICGGAAAYATDYLSKLGYQWPTTYIYFAQTMAGLSSGLATYKILGSKIVKQTMDIIKNPNFHFTKSAVWIGMQAYRFTGQFGVVNNLGENEETNSIASSYESYYTANDDSTSLNIIRDEL